MLERVLGPQCHRGVEEALARLKRAAEGLRTDAERIQRETASKQESHVL